MRYVSGDVLSLLGPARIHRVNAVLLRLERLSL